MTTGTLLKQFARDEDLALLLRERELRFLKERPADSALTQGDIAGVIAFCDRTLFQLKTEEKLMQEYEHDLEELEKEIAQVSA